jgi:hypothetical protein
MSANDCESTQDATDFHGNWLEMRRLIESPIFAKTVGFLPASGGGRRRSFMNFI